MRLISSASRYRAVVNAKLYVPSGVVVRAAVVMFRLVYQQIRSHSDVAIDASGHIPTPTACQLGV